MEKTKNKEVPGRILQRRIRDKQSRTFLLHLDENREEAFPTADRTGYLMVWLRRGGSLPPKPNVFPDERWYLTPLGAVVRDVWDLPDESVDGSDVDPVLVQQYVPIVDGICKGCDQLPALNGRCGCS